VHLVSKDQGQTVIESMPPTSTQRNVPAFHVRGYVKHCAVALSV